MRPHCLVAPVVAAAWGEKGSAVLPAAGAGRSIAGVTHYLDFGPVAEGGLSFMAQDSPAPNYELFLPFQ